MLNFISALLIFVCITVFLFLNKNKKGFELNFIMFFSIGYVYYFSVPLIFYSNFKDFDIDEFDVIRNYLDGVDFYGMLFYGVLSILYFLLTIIGYLVAGFGKKTNVKKNIENSKIKINFIFAVAISLAILSAIPVYENFFKGYDESIFEGYIDGVVAGAIERGTYVASVTIVFSCFLIKASNAFLDKNRTTEPAFIFFIKSPSFLIYTVFSILMVSMGGRLYFISHMIALCVMANCLRKYYITWSKILIIFMAIAVALGLYGVLRAKSPITAGAIALNLVQEPLYTSISLFSYVAGNYWEAFRVPYFLLSDLSNILPSFIWHDKSNYLLKPVDLGFDIGIPLGGFHLFVSLMINFGYIGSGILMFFFGWCIGWIERKKYKWEISVIYSLIVGWCTFSLFRDPFSISLVKNIFQYSIIMPFILMRAVRINK